MFGKVKESEQHLNINWKHFYLSVLALVIPMALQNLINVGVTAADVVMLGKVGEHALSGASLAGQVQYIMTLFLFGLTSGATVLTAQYWGKKDICTIEKILGLGMRSAVIVTAVFFVAAQCIPHTLMKIFTSDPEVIEQGVVYLRIVSWSYIFMGITQTYLYIMRSVERVVVATVANATMEIPDAMIDTEVRQMANDFSQRIMQQGLTMEQYFQFTGMTAEKMLEELRPQAVKRIETRLVLEAIAKAENIEISDEKLDEELAKMAEAYKMEVEKLKEFMGEAEKKQMKADMAVQEAVTFLVESAVEA